MHNYRNLQYLTHHVFEDNLMIRSVISLCGYVLQLPTFYAVSQY